MDKQIRAEQLKKRVYDKAAIIINPVAGKMKAKSCLYDILSPLGASGCETTVYITKCRGDAARAAREYSKSCDLIVCCGGDGTLNEVMNGILQTEKKPTLCYFPMGTTNDFGNTLGLPKTLTASTLDIPSREVMTLDAGILNDSEYFAYIASFGIFTKASYTADQTMKNYLGHLAYVLEGAKELSDLGKSYNIRLTCPEGTVDGRFIFGAVTNSTSVGGVYRLPKSKVKLDDGLFEIMLIRAPQNAIDMQLTLQMLTQNKYDGKNIIFMQSSDIRIISDSKLAWCTDGEFAGDFSRVEIRNLAGAIKLVR